MNQYCRYCANALDYNGDATDFVCTAKAKCGNNGAGQFYNAAKAKRPNKCKYYELNPLDVFYTTYGEHYYTPRVRVLMSETKKRTIYGEQQRLEL